MGLRSRINNQIYPEPHSSTRYPLTGNYAQIVLGSDASATNAGARRWILETGQFLPGYGSELDAAYPVDNKGIFENVLTTTVVPAAPNITHFTGSVLHLTSSQVRKQFVFGYAPYNGVITMESASIGTEVIGGVTTYNWAKGFEIPAITFESGSQIFSN
tara:strand:- start:110 stop:586 length:477 start_codon:yes stop_codon:yes gene_type:complete